MKSLMLKTQLMQCVFLLILAFICRSVNAADEIEVYVTYRIGDPTTQYFDSGEQIDLEITNNWERINVYYASGPLTDQDIGRISLTGDTDARLDVILGANAWHGGDLNTLAGVDFGGITAVSGVEDYIWFEGYVNGDLTGSIQVGLMANFDVNGSIEAQIKTTAANDVAAEFLLEAGTGINLTGSEKIWTVYQDIGYIIVAAGDINAEILAENGQIWHPEMANTGIAANDGHILKDITAGGGRIMGVYSNQDIGASGYPIEITATGTSGDDIGIGYIYADNIYADITVGGVGDRIVHQVYATEEAVGDFVGSLSAGSLYKNDETYDVDNKLGIIIEDNLSADITFDGSVDLPIDIGGSFMSGKTISIGDNFRRAAETGYYGSMSIGDEDGLIGQVIINANDNGGSWGNAAEVTIYGTDLDPIPYYEDLSGDLGGGAVGEAPFYFHATDCTPAHNGQITGASQEVEVRHYGPITYTSGMPVTINRRLITTPVSPQSWEDVTSWYEVTSNTGTVLVIEPVTNKYWYGPYQYKIEPVLTSGDNQLRCVDVDGTPAVTDYDYQFYYTP